MSLLANLPVFAAATGFDITTVIESAVSKVQTDIFSVLGIVVPAIVGVTGAVVAVRFGLKWLRQLGKG